MRLKVSVSLDEKLFKELRDEAEQKNLSVSRLIENKLKGINEVKKVK